MSSLNTIITVKGRESMAKGRAGDVTLPTITGMAFGDGGVDAGGNVKTPTASQSTLNDELYRKVITNHEFISSTACRYYCTLSTSEMVGESISEIGLYDSNGDLVMIKNFLPKGKDADMELTFYIDDIF